MLIQNVRNYSWQKRLFFFKPHYQRMEIKPRIKKKKMKIRPDMSSICVGNCASEWQPYNIKDITAYFMAASLKRFTVERFSLCDMNLACLINGLLKGKKMKKGSLFKEIVSSPEKLSFQVTTVVHSTNWTELNNPTFA